MQRNKEHNKNRRWKKKYGGCLRHGELKYISHFLSCLNYLILPSDWYVTIWKYTVQMSAVHNSSVIEVWKSQRYEILPEQEKSIRLIKLEHFPLKPFSEQCEQQKGLNFNYGVALHSTSRF